MSTRYWFTPAPGYTGPAIELVAGWHSKGGKFFPKNVKRSPAAISRLNKYESRRGFRPFPMVGDPSRDEREIYAMHMAQKVQP